MPEKIDKNLEMKLLYASTDDLMRLADRYADKCGLKKVNS
jgi:hypothetical protein